MSQALLSAVARFRSDYVISVYADYGASILALRCSVPGLGAALARVDSIGIVHHGHTGSVHGWRDRVHDGIHRMTRRLSPWSKTIVVNPMLLEAIESQGSDARGTHRLLPHPVERPRALYRQAARAALGYAEDAIVFTNVPTTYKAFFNQRRRCSHGLIEAFPTHPNILLRPQMTTLFIFWNALFPVLDIAYVLIFIPGVIAALMGNFAIAGPATLAVLPLALGINLVMFLVQRPMFDEQGLKVRGTSSASSAICPSIPSFSNPQRSSDTFTNFSARDVAGGRNETRDQRTRTRTPSRNASTRVSRASAGRRVRHGNRKRAR